MGEVYSVDASRRTTAANAYVTGLGPTKRVVLFDTLLDRYAATRSASSSRTSWPTSATAMSRAAWPSPRWSRRSVALAIQRLSWALAPSQRGTAGALPALALAAVAVSAPTGLIGNRLSRAIERRADAFSLTLTGAPDAFISFERTIAVQNVADLDPPRWLTRFWPRTRRRPERIGSAVSFAAAAKAVYSIRGDSPGPSRSGAATELGQVLDPLAGLPLGVVVLHGVDQLAHELRREVDARHDDAGDLLVLDLVVDTGERDRELVVRVADVGEVRVVRRP